jgi:hypothetical protein
MKTGIELAERLLDNINKSLVLRTHIPYLDMLKDLVEGGLTPTSAMINTSSNFGSFDTHLIILLNLLHTASSSIINPTQAPLPLAAIRENLTSNLNQLEELLQAAAENNLPANGRNNAGADLILNSLEQINRASV